MRSLRHIAPQSNSPIYPPLPQGAYIRGQQRRTRKILELPEAEQSAAITKEKEEKKVPVDFTISAFLTFLTPAPQAANDRDKAQRIQLVKAHMRLFCSTKCFLNATPPQFAQEIVADRLSSGLDALTEDELAAAAIAKKKNYRNAQRLKKVKAHLQLFFSTKCCFKHRPKPFNPPPRHRSSLKMFPRIVLAMASAIAVAFASLGPLEAGS